MNVEVRSYNKDYSVSCIDVISCAYRHLCFMTKELITLPLWTVLKIYNSEHHKDINNIEWDYCYEL